MSSALPPPNAPAEVGLPRAAPRIDEEGNYVVWAKLSYVVVGVYLFLLLLIFLLLRSSSVFYYAWVPYFLAAVVLFFLFRYLSTNYRIDADRLRAARILGGRTVPLEEVRRIQFASLRELSPVGFFGSWGYRGRMWSPVIGPMDSIHTDSSGILIYAGNVPLFVSPKDPQGFIRELSRRVRSYRGPLEVDEGSSTSPSPPSG